MNPKVSDILIKAIAPGERVKIDGAYHLTEAGEIVPASDERGVFVLLGENGSLPAALAHELNLPIKAEEPKADAKAASGVTFPAAPGSSAEKAALSASEASNDLPADFPGRNALLSAGLTRVADVQGRNVEDLTQLPGVGAATADKILSYGK